MADEITFKQYADSIAALMELALQDTSGSRAAAQVLLSAYNGYAFQLDVTDLGVLDRHNLKNAIVVIKGRTTLATEPHKLLVDGDALFKGLWDRWSNLHVNARCEH